MLPHPDGGPEAKLMSVFFLEEDMAIEHSPIKNVLEKLCFPLSAGFGLVCREVAATS